jgi:hypothetical protein
MLDGFRDLLAAANVKNAQERNEKRNTLNPQLGHECAIVSWMFVGAFVELNVF